MNSGNKKLSEEERKYLLEVIKQTGRARKIFRYDYCEPGKFYFDKLPISPIPATMKVITRTNLHKKRMAAEGKLIYKKKEFREGIVHMFA